MSAAALVVTHLAAVALGALLVLAATELAGRRAAAPTRHLERQDARARAVLEADRSRWSNLALTLAQGMRVSLPELVQTAPAQPPPPDRDLAGRDGPDPEEILSRLYTGDPHELTDEEQDQFDDAALGIARH